MMTMNDCYDDNNLKMGSLIIEKNIEIVLLHLDGNTYLLLNQKVDKFIGKEAIWC